MLQPKKEKTCKCGTSFKVYRTTDKYCSFECKRKYSKPVDLKLKPLYKIPKKSKKRIVDEAKYSVLRIEFLGKPENRICFIDGCNQPATSIEHRAGRWGSNYLDTSTWAGCCLKHNLELENNPELSKKYQLSKITGKHKL